MSDLEGNVQLGRPQQSYAHNEPVAPNPHSVNMSGYASSQILPPPSQHNKPVATVQQNFNISNATHPFACFFHILFKSLAILAYVLPLKMVTGQTTLFVIVVLMGAFDFWTVKNVTGRYPPFSLVLTF